MDYIGTIYRPPSEADSLILQITLGCSHNMCTFCPNYKTKRFSVKDWAAIKADMDEAASYSAAHPGAFTKAFLADGDALILDTAFLLQIIDYLRTACPSIKRIGVYANTKSLLLKTPAELEALKAAGLGIVYHGVESGNTAVLRAVKKGASPALMIQGAQKVIGAGILLSQMVLLGIGGTALSSEHARDTGELLSAMSPDYASALTVMLIPGTPLYDEAARGDFIMPGKRAIIQELRGILEHLNPSRPCFFTSNHASNYLPIRAEFPREKAATLALIDQVLAGKSDAGLRPEYARAL